MYKKIMVAVDGSSMAMLALDEAVKLVKSQGAELTLVYVIEYPHVYVSDLGYDPLPVTEALVVEGRRVLDKAESLVASQNIAFRSLLVDNRTSTDSIAEQLRKVADEQQADLVVLGTHGRGGFKRLLLGSVAEGFLRLSTHPILLVPGKQDIDQHASA